jgi:hypothetical protein
MHDWSDCVTNVQRSLRTDLAAADGVVANLRSGSIGEDRECLVAQ